MPLNSYMSFNVFNCYLVYNKNLHLVIEDSDNLIFNFKYYIVHKLKKGVIWL